MATSTDIFLAFNNLNLVQSHNWWPNKGSFEVVISAVLVNRTKWENVLLSIQNLKQHNIISLQDFVCLEQEKLAELIKQSGFNKQKSHTIISLCTNIYNEFGDFNNFVNCVDKEWLLSQKGIGMETCDAILCYACNREVMVIDSYARYILKFLNYEFESYDEASEFLSNLDFKYIFSIGFEDINEIYAHFHAMIVQFCKKFYKKQQFLGDGLQVLQLLKSI